MLVGATVSVGVGVTAYVSGVLSGLVTVGGPAHAQVIPVIGWTFLGISSLIHLTVPARAWPPGSGCGPAGVVWAIFLGLAGIEYLVAKKLGVLGRVRARVARRSTSTSPTPRDAGMSAPEARRHNQRLGVN
ncbi:MAG TPA: hypothetical protein VG205_09540 [Acidimicrobiales bacterium]|nr:hypothetical protein [Acidimicrobiales bacterium]